MGRRAGLAVALLLLAAGLLLLHELVVGLYRVPTASMAPDILPGDVVVVDRRAYDLRLPFSDQVLLRTGRIRPGDVVLVRAPGTGGGLWVKRVLAVGGQQIGFVGGAAWIDGEAPILVRLGGVATLDGRCRPYTARQLAELTPQTALPIRIDRGLGNLWRHTPPVRVPAHHVMLVGDNRDRSIDGRRYGPTPVASVVGRVVGVALSWDPCTRQPRRERWGMEVPRRGRGEEAAGISRGRSAPGW